MVLLNKRGLNGCGRAGGAEVVEDEGSAVAGSVVASKQQVDINMLNIQIGFFFFQIIIILLSTLATLIYAEKFNFTQIYLAQKLVQFLALVHWPGVCHLLLELKEINRLKFTENIH